MKFTCDYATLVENLSDISTVAEDSMLKDDTKNVIFKFDADGTVTLLGIVPQMLIFKRFIEKDKYRLEFSDAEKEGFQTQINNGGVASSLYFQIKSKELTGFLNSYKSVRRTQVDEVSLETTDKGAIRCTVLERDKDEDGYVAEDAKKHLSYWSFNNIPLRQNQMADITIKAPEEQLISVDNRFINLYTKNLVPIMQSGGTNLYSFLACGSDYIVAFDNAFTVLMANNQEGFKDVFSNMRLSYRAVSFMDKVIAVNQDILVCKTEKHLYFKTANSEAFISYDTKLPDYAAYANAYKKDHAVVLDRIYVKDILKRLALVNESIEVTINPELNIVNLKNSKFSQDIEIMSAKAMEEMGTIHFKIAPDKLNACIIGNDAEFNFDVRIYFTRQPDGKKIAIIFTDGTGAWFSVVRVNTY